MMKRKMNTISIGLVLLAALLMIIPATAVQTTNINEVPNAIDFEYVQVPITGPETVDNLKALGLEVVDDSGWAAIVKMPLSLKTTMMGKVNFIEMPNAKEINFLEEGYKFDVTKGVDIPAEWKSTGSNEYVVQFIAPIRAKWIEEIGTIGKIQRYVGDNAVVMKLSPEQKTKLSALPYVQWIGTYEPAFKVYRSLREKTGDVRVKAFAYKDADLQTLAKDLVAMGATDILVRDDWEHSVSFVIDSAKLPDVARLDSVMLMKENPVMKTYNNVGGEITRAHVLWDTSKSNLPQTITGEGQVIHVQDTRLDDTHWDFTQGPLGNRIVYVESSSDSSDHGTHVTGIVAGNGYCMEQWLGLDNSNRIYYELASSNPLGKPDLAGFAGRAPEASISFGAGLSSSDWSTGYSNGARIFTNSWGPGTVTPGYDGTADSFMDSNPDALVLFAAGNDGPNEVTVGGAANDKMGLGIGAGENHRPDLFDSEDDPNQVAVFSSRGPVDTNDMRIKPDLIEIGTGVYSTKGDWTSNDASTVYKGSDVDSTLLIDVDGDGVGDYENYQGTSMACPAAAGDAILVRDWLVDVEGISNPEPMLIKALLINGAEDMGYGFPSYDQGWGRINVENSIAPPAPRTNLYWVASTTSTWTQTINVVDGDIPLKVTMAHRDTDTSSGSLTVDYDLTVTAPDGNTVYQGNLFNNSVSVPGTGSASDWANAHFPPTGRTDGSFGLANSAYDWDTENDGGDDLNTVEQVIIPNPTPGNWTITVTLKSGSDVNFAVVAAGNFGPKNNVDYEVELTSDYPRTYPLVDGGGEATFTAAPGGSIAYGFTVYNHGPNPDTISLTATLPSGWSISFNPGSSISLDPGAKQHVIAEITIPSTASAGTNVIKITGTSGNDVNSPIAQDYLLLNVDVVTQKLPSVTQLTTSELHDDAPQIAAFTYSGTDYVLVAYRHDVGMGARVFVKVSTDGGQTFGDPIQVSTSADGPSFLGLNVKLVGSNYLGRAFITWNAYKPAEAGDDTASTTGNRVMIAYADPPYTTWTEVIAFDGGEGPGQTGFFINTQPANGYRSIFTAFYNDEVHLIVECFEYDSQDLTQAQITGIDTVEKISTDGGATWSSWTVISPQDGNYYFFPSGYTDLNTGNIVLWYYWRTSSGNDRDLLYQEYSGSWGSGVTAWDTTDNVMFPFGTFTSEGANGDRNYGAVCKGANPDSDKNLYVVYTDDQGGTFTTGLGPFGPIIDDSNYGARYVLDMDTTTDGYVWASYLRSPSSDPYNQPNAYSIRTNDGFNTVTETLVTADSFTKGFQRAAGSGSNLLYTYYSNSRAGNMDLWYSTLYNGWESAGDTLGPLSEDVNADLLEVSTGGTVTAYANINDWKTGGSNIVAAECFFDTDPGVGNGQAMSAMDGAFDNPQEAVKGTITAPSTEGTHYLYVRGQDAAGNWGEAKAVAIVVVASSTPQISVDFANGWDLVSLPWLTSPTDIDTALSGLSWTRAMVYQNGAWYTYDVNRATQYNLGFPTVDNTVGIWVYSSSGTLTKDEPSITSTDIQLNVGWNLVGYPSKTTRTVSDALSTFTGAYDYVQTYDPNTGQIITLSGTDNMEMGRAYWIHVTTAGTWTVDW